MEDRLKSGVLRVTRHIHDGNYQAVITSGKSGFISVSFVEAGLQNLYGDEEMLPIYDFGGEGGSLLWKKVSADDQRIRRAKMRALDDHITCCFPELNQSRDRKMIYVDDYANSGEKMMDIPLVFKALGFSQLDYAVIVSSFKIPEEVFKGITDMQLVDYFFNLTQTMHDIDLSRRADVLEEIKRLSDYICIR